MKQSMLVNQYPLIPRQAFLFFPREDQICQTRNKQTYRIIFDGGVPYTSQERAKLNQLHEEIKRQKKNEHIGFMQQSTLMRFLQATKFNVEDCLEQLKKYKKWQDSILPLTLKPDIEILLQKGFFYLAGRDVKYRPVIVVNVPKIIEAGIKEKKFYELAGYFFQYVVQNCLIEGQIETWVTIIDLGRLGMFSLGGTVIDTIKFLSNHFRCRLHRSFLVNCPGSITFLFGMVKKAMTEDQINKINLTEENFLPKEAFRQLFQDEIQQKYGGKKMDITQYWPSTIQKREPSSHQKARLISLKQYGQKHDKGLLNKTKVSKQLLLEYEDLKNTFVKIRSAKQLMIQNIQFSFKRHKGEENSQGQQASDEDDPPQIHLIPQPFSLSGLFQFKSKMSLAFEESK